jgi:hypothetical protein
MALAQQHFIQTGLNPSLARVRSRANRVYDAVPSMVLGDARLHEVFFIDSAGAYESFSGAGYATLGAKVGQPGATALFSATPVTAITNGWQFTLAVTASATTACFLEFSVAVTSGVQTMAILPVEIADDVT